MRVLFHCLPADEDATGSIEQFPGVITHPDRDPYHYRASDLSAASAGLPWDLELIGDWGHPKNQKMVRARLRFEATRAAAQTRGISAADARRLRAGEAHYSAYVGPPAQWDFMGATQFRLLTALGLRSTHRLLDLGCGSLRAGRFLMMYLDAGNYFGIEPNTWLLSDAIEREIGQSLVDLKRPSFNDTQQFDTEAFGVQFDFIVAQSIFSHAGPELVAKALSSCARSLGPDGIALVTFIHPDQMPGAPMEAPGWTYPGCTTFEPKRVLELIAAAGLVGRKLPWFHPRQTWYAIAHSREALPSEGLDRHLSGAVLRDAEFAESVAR